MRGGSASFRPGVAAIVLAALVAVAVVARPWQDGSPGPATPVAPAVPGPVAAAGTAPAASAGGAASARVAGPRVRAPEAVVVDLDTGQVLFAKDPDRERPVASLTKLMTALLVVQHASLQDLVTVSADAAHTDPINVGLQRGERITVRDLLYGLLLWSGNDTAVALAEHVSGSVHAFVTLMNRTAADLGLGGSHFAGPNGLNDHGRSTATDMATLARIVLRDATIAPILATRHHRIAGPPRQVHKLRNLNRVLFTYPGATGVKTGYTRAAGTCVIGSATRDGHSVVAVVLGDRTGDGWRSAYGDTKALLDAGFAFEAAANPAAA